MSSSLPEKKFNIEKLNFNSIKSELSTIPKIVKKKSHIGVRSSTSLNHSNHNDSYSNDPKALTLTPSTRHKQSPSSDNIIPLKQMIKSNSTKNFDQEYVSNISKNYKIKISMIENEKKKAIELMQKENEEYVNKIKEQYENRIKELTNYYENKISGYEKVMLNQLNELKNINVNYITIAEHKNIISNNNIQWKEKLESYKKEYDDYIAKLTNILSYKEKYKSLLTRMYLYKAKEYNISKIEKELREENKLRVKQKPAAIPYMEDITKLSELCEEVNLSTALFELKLLYKEKMDQIEEINDKEISNMITSVNKTFNNMLNARNVEGTNKIDPQENITIQTKEKEKQINESNKQALFSHSSKKNILSTERYINEDKNDPLDNIIINDSALRSKSSMEFDSINFEDSFPNKPTNVLVVNDIIHDK